MGYLSTLTATQQQAIVSALATVTPVPVPTDGAGLYSTYCAGCHGTLASSGVRGFSASIIQSAINRNTGGMGSLSTLTAAQLQLISIAIK
jgi:mono/diheme cytochrome c family protein